MSNRALHYWHSFWACLFTVLWTGHVLDDQPIFASVMALMVALHVYYASRRLRPTGERA